MAHCHLFSTPTSAVVNSSAMEHGVGGTESAPQQSPAPPHVGDVPDACPEIRPAEETLLRAYPGLSMRGVELWAVEPLPDEGAAPSNARPGSDVNYLSSFADAKESELIDHAGFLRTELITSRAGIRHFRKQHRRASFIVDVIWRRVLEGRLSLARASVQCLDACPRGRQGVRLPLPVPSWLEERQLPNWVGMVEIDRRGALFSKLTPDLIPRACSATGVARIAYEKGVKYQGSVQNLRYCSLWEVGRYELVASMRRKAANFSSLWRSIKLPKLGEELLVFELHVEKGDCDCFFCC